MKTYIFAIICIIMFTACSTWDGVKKDSSNAWEVTKDTTSKAYKGTKKAIHNATAE